MTQGFALIAASVLLASANGAASATEAPVYAPLAFLIGHCWQGTFPDSTVTDRHCFSWVYGDKFVRDQHVVHTGDGKPDSLGETVYVWDGESRQLQYLYIESAGGFARGTVSSEGATLTFPATTYLEKGEKQTYRSRWLRTGADGYDVKTEFLQKGHWVEGFSLHMQRVPGP
jgi:hypothetical protein